MNPEDTEQENLEEMSDEALDGMISEGAEDSIAPWDRA